jgi:copper(I)-binding protein
VSLVAALAWTPLGWVAAEPVTDVTVSDPWVREMPPGMRMTAAYMMLSNRGPTERVLTGVSSAMFGSAEIHRTVQSGGKASMLQQDRVSIPAQSEIQFTPGGYHIMLMDAEEMPRGGDKVPLTLHFANGDTLEIEAQVKASAGATTEHHHHHGH